MLFKYTSTEVTLKLIKQVQVLIMWQRINNLQTTIDTKVDLSYLDCNSVFRRADIYNKIPAETPMCTFCTANCIPFDQSSSKLSPVGIKLTITGLIA